MTIFEVIKWFWILKLPTIANNDPQLAEMISFIEVDIIEGNHLPDNRKKFIGFMLFSYSMFLGPQSFFEIEKLSVQHGVENEIKFFAENWISYCRKKP